MKASRDMVKTLIQIAPSVEEADKVIEENYELKSFGEKIAFLLGMFDVQVISIDDVDGIEKEESEKMTYFSLLSTIIIAK